MPSQLLGEEAQTTWPHSFYLPGTKLISKREATHPGPFRGTVSHRDTTAARGSCAEIDELLTLPTHYFSEAPYCPWERQEHPRHPEATVVSWARMWGYWKVVWHPQLGHVVLLLDLISQNTEPSHSVIIMKGGKQDQLIIFSKEDKDKITVWTTHSEHLPLRLLWVIAISLPMIALVLP